MGQSYIACNDVTSDEEIRRLTAYVGMMEKFVREYGLLAPKGSIKETEVKKKTVDEALEELNSLTGLDAVKQDVNSLVNLMQVQKIREERGMKQPSVSKHLVLQVIREPVKQRLQDFLPVYIIRWESFQKGILLK